MKPLAGTAAVGACVALALAAGVTFARWDDAAPAPSRAVGMAPSPSAPEGPPIPTRAYLRDACKMPPKWVQRIHRGWDPATTRAYDLVIVPNPPNYVGTFVNTSHSAPYDFLQKVPLVFYGPGFIRPVGDVRLDGEPTIADLAPTYAELMRFDFPRRQSHAITEVLRPDAAVPRLIVTVVIDGGGWNVLRRWPDAWPNLARLIDRGASVEGAIVGSSPSITPAIHTTLATGSFPRHHGVTAIAVRAADGNIVGAFSEEDGNPGVRAMDPTVTLRQTTLGDLWDRARDNRPRVGMIAAGNLQLGMVGHGSALRGGDRDVVAITRGRTWDTKRRFYSLPAYVNEPGEGPANEVQRLDVADGERDHRWRGHELWPITHNPAFASWQTRTTFKILEGEGFGRDSVTDLFYANYKSPDKAGHKWNMIAPEQADVLASVDESIGDLVTWLDGNVGRDEYVLVVTADHGQTPLEAGGWPINRDEILGDLGRRFDRIDNGAGVIERTSASSFFARVDEMRANDVTPEQIASFLSRYRMGDNIPEGGEIPQGYEDRLDEPIFAAVFPGRQLPEVVTCTGALD